MKKNRDVLDTEALKPDLKRRTIRGGLYTMTGEGVNLVLRLGSIAVLARILIPEHFGLIGMVTVLTVIAERFKDLGLSMATIQNEKITHEQVSNLFWINVIFGIFIMLGFCLLSNLIAWFYGDERLILITVALAISFLWSGANAQHQAILRRQMRFAELTTVGVSANFLSIILSIILALKGYGYWALVWKEVALSFFSSVGIWMVSPWIPGWPARNVEMGHMMRMGRDMTGFNLIILLTQNLDQILIGKFSGASQLGIYRQSFQLVMAPVNQLIVPVHSVAVSTLSILQNDPARYRQYVKKLVTLLGFVSMPAMMFAFVYSKQITLVILGEKWIESAPIIGILALAAFMRPVSSIAGLVMVTCGKTKRFFFLALLNSTIMVSAYCIGVKWGAIGIAIAIVFTTYITLPMIFIVFKDTPVNVGLFLHSLLLPAISSLSMGLILLLFSRIFPIQNSVIAIVAALPIAVAVYFAAWMVMREGRQLLKEIFSDVVFFFKKGEDGRGVGLS